MTLEQLNTLPEDEALAVFRDCCAADAWARAWRERYVNRRAVRLVDGLDDVCGGIQIHIVWWCDVHGDLS